MPGRHRVASVNGARRPRYMLCATVTAHEAPLPPVC